MRSYGFRELDLTLQDYTDNLDGLTALQHLDPQQRVNNTGKITDAGLVHLKGLQLTSLAIPNDAKTDLGLKHYLAALETHAAVHDGRVGRGRSVLGNMTEVRRTWQKSA